METNNDATPDEVWCTLAGQVDHMMVQRVFNFFANALHDQVGTVHLLIQSPGGFVSDGIALYNYLVNLPIKIVAYNNGGVLSIAVVMFLAAPHRIASDTATFMIHKTHTSPQAGVTAAELNAIANSLDIDNDRVEAILKRHITMPQKKWALHQHADLVLIAAEAKQFTLIHEIGPFAPPPGGRIFNI